MVAVPSNHFLGAIGVALLLLAFMLDVSRRVESKGWSTAFVRRSPL